MGPARTTRRQFLRAALGVGGAAVLGTGIYSTLYEPFELKVERISLAFPRLPREFDGLKIAQLSDLHYKPFTEEGQIRAAVQQCNRLNPDLVVITGDFITAPLWGSSAPQVRHAEVCARILSGLRAPWGVFAALGNHDLAVDAYGISEILRAQHLRVVRNSAQPVERNGARIWLAGLDDCLYGKPDLHRTLAHVPSNEFTALLVHEPDVADQARSYPVDLQISGHSHGGQVRLPWLGAPYLPPLARKYPWGLYRVGRLVLYSNRGIGTIGLPVRLNAPPEVTLFTLRCPGA